MAHRRLQQYYSRRKNTVTFSIPQLAILLVCVFVMGCVSMFSVLLASLPIITFPREQINNGPYNVMRRQSLLRNTTSMKKEYTQISDTKTLSTTTPSENKRKEQFFFNKTEGGIDVVYLWVNGSDPLNKEKMIQYSNESFIPIEQSLNRYREWNELYYSLILLFRHASNIRNVFVVTAGERPRYVDQFQQLIWVNHTEFIPSQYLPTFSSFSIEYNLFYLLPRLSDPFIEMNDDFFIRKPVNLKEYSDKRTWYEDVWTVRRATDAHGKLNLQFNSYMNANRVLKKIFPKHSPKPLTLHLPLVVRHDTLSELPEYTFSSYCKKRNAHTPLTH